MRYHQNAAIDYWCFDYLGRQDDFKKEQLDEAQEKKTGKGPSSDKNVSAKELLARRKAARLEGRGAGGGDD